MMKIIDYIVQDYSVNRNSPKIFISLIMFRIAQIIYKNKGGGIWWLGLPFLVLYRIIVEWLFCIELRPKTKVGKGLKIEHGFGLVVNDNAILGDYVHLRHCVTIGCVKNQDGSQGPSPIIGNNVEVGANSVVIGGIVVGNSAKIGAGAVVVKDVLPDSVVVGNPMRVIKRSGLT